MLETKPPRLTGCEIRWLNVVVGMYVPFVSCVFVGGLEVLPKFEGDIKYGVAV
jgi:hypothetical protein